jgi:predicted DNA-binding protein with PD1-like motif
MKVAEGTIGRVFVVRLEDGDKIPDSIERFAAEKNIEAAFCTLLGGVKAGTLVVGPEDGNADVIVPMPWPLSGVHEAVALGTIFPDEGGNPSLHMHGALGRAGDTRTGCLRLGIDIWKIGEVVITEILGTGMVRKREASTGFELLDVKE